MDGLNVQLRDELGDYLGTIRAQLVATPPPAQPRWVSAVPADSGMPTPGQPSKPKWASAVPTDSGMPPPQPPKPRRASVVPPESEKPTGPPTDSMLKRLDELIAALDQAASLKEGVDTVERLARLTRECQTIVLDMESRFKFNAIKLPQGKNSAVDFSKIRGCIQLTSRYYDRLAFYRTDEGKNYLRGVVSVKTTLDSEGDVAVRDHHFDERLDPLASVRDWKYKQQYLPWADKQIAKGSDPVEHIVEFLIDKTIDGPPTIANILANIWPTEARLHLTDLVGPSLTVQVRTHVPGDERFSLPRGAPRMWTYQVKVPVGLGSWKWTYEVWAANAASLPILRVVHTVAKSDGSGRRGVSDDFTRGTLYAMRGPSTMRCYPTSKFHSALFDAEITSAAGILVADEGRVVAIDNRSGHYQPGYRQLQTAVQFLQSNLLFDPDAFVSVFVAQSDAFYFSPADFLAAAQSGMNFRVVTDSIARRAQQFGYRLPVATRHADLIPATLRDFPIDNGRNRWDRMLASYYGGDDGLETIVKDLKAALKPQWATARTEVAKSATGRRQESHAALASQTLKAIESGGAYCNLLALVRELLTASQPIAEAGQNSLIQANLRYRNIAGRLAALKPDRSTC